MFSLNLFSSKERGSLRSLAQVYLDCLFSLLHILATLHTSPSHSQLDLLHLVVLFLTLLTGPNVFHLVVQSLFQVGRTYVLLALPHFSFVLISCFQSSVQWAL